jgi:hypothetical protein
MSSFEEKINQFSTNMDARMLDGSYDRTLPENVPLNTLTMKEVEQLLKTHARNYASYAHLFTNVDGSELEKFGICDIMVKRNNRQLSTKMMEVARSLDKYVQRWKIYGVKYSKTQKPTYEFTTGIIRTTTGEEDAEGWVIYNSHLFPNEVAAGLIPTWTQYINEGMRADQGVVNKHFNF